MAEHRDGPQGAIFWNPTTLEPTDEYSSDNPSPGEVVPGQIAPANERGNFQRSSQSSQDIGTPGDHSGYFGSSSRKNSSFGLSGKSAAQGRGRRDSENLWTRSKSIAESYIKPQTSTSHSRTREGDDSRRRSSVVAFVTATSSESGDTGADFGRPLVQQDSRRASVGNGGSRPPHKPAYQHKRGRSDSSSNLALRRTYSSVDTRNLGSNYPGTTNAIKSTWDRRLSFGEYFQPTAERGRRHSAVPRERMTTTAYASSIDSSARPSVDGIPTATNPAGHKPFPGYRKGSTESPTYVNFSRRSSKAEDPFGNPLAKVRSLVLINEKPVYQAGVYFRSRRNRERKTDFARLKQSKDPRQKWLSLIPLIGILLGFCVAGVYIFFGIRSVPVHKYCMVYQDDFSSGTLDPAVWTKEVQLGGYGNGQFEETTATDENVFIKDGMLQIVPTLQDPALLNHNATLNLTQLGICTSDQWYNCVATTNTTNGTIVNPVRSGRIDTKKGANIKYGRIEVEAKMPQGDWLWPAIWLMPRDSVYGIWPKSGEIDIAESRGNNWTYPTGGNNIISSTLHWGPDPANDAWWRTYGKQKSLFSTFPDKFHVFGLEWSEKYLYTYLDSRLMQVLYNKFTVPFWKRGDFPLTFQNGTAIIDPWSQSGNPASPFDQDFFLILNVAVGGTNGWFEDGQAGKPWVDASPTAKRDFWAAKDQWYPTWQDGDGAAMQVRSVKMWQQQGYNGCLAQAVNVP